MINTKNIKVNQIEFRLQKYNGRKSRYECPQCHDSHSFTRYVDSNGNFINAIVGRCDHESSCGYHYTPRQFFVDNPHLNDFGKMKHSSELIKPRKKTTLDTIPETFLKQSQNAESDLMDYLCSVFGSESAMPLVDLYHLGATQQRDIIYWQIDINGKTRTGKVMKYDKKSGHRVKNGSGVNWIHAILKKRGELPDDWQLTQCLFGEHLLSLKGNENRLVVIVESEKTALIGAIVYPEQIWLATGGKSQLSIDKMMVLKGRRVIMFPDVDGYDEWSKRATQFTFCKTIVISNLLEEHATPQQRIDKIDIADWIIAQNQDNKNTTVETCLSEEGRILKDMIIQNPFIAVLIKQFKLNWCD